jgi:prepilin-type processing-associated H-X9-DG protein
MKQLQHTIPFYEGKLNSDVDVELMPKGDSPVDPSEQHSGRLNFVMIDGHIGILSNPKGNTLIDLDIYSYLIIASKWDEENNALILFLDDSARGLIIRILNTGIIEVIYWPGFVGGETLNFSSTEVIRNIKIIGSGTDAQLCWVSDRNPPRCINIAQIIANTATTPIDLALDSPIKIPTLTLGTDATVSSNNIYNKGYQFAVQFIYFDGKESSWSDWTYPLYPSRQYESVNGVSNKNIVSYNRIRISYTGIPSGVTEVKIGYRYVDIGSGVPSAWYLYDIVAVSASAITYYFFDNKNISAIDPDDILSQFYDVPLFGTDLEFLKDNKIAILNPVLGYDNVPITISLETLYRQAFSWATTFLSTDIASGATEDITLQIVANTSLFIVFSDEGAYDVSFSILINVGSASDDYSYQVVRLADEYKVGGNNYFTIIRLSTNTIRVVNILYYTGHVHQNVISNAALREKSQKAGAIRYLAIAYTYDNKNRKGSANISNTSYLSIPFWPDLRATITETNYVLAIGYEISNVADSEATGWEILDGGSNINNFYEIPLVCNTKGVPADNDIIYTNGLITLDVNAADDRILAKNPNYSTLITFDAAVGDRVRFISKGTFAVSPDYESRIVECNTLFTNTIDLEIIGVDQNGVLTLESNITNTELSDIIGNGSNHVVVVEVYSLNRNIPADTLAYTSIGVKGIVSGGYHQHVSEAGTWYKNSDGTAFVSRNQTASLSCRGVAIIGGYKIMANTHEMNETANLTQIQAVMPILETERMSFAYNSNYQGGKVNYVDAQAMQRTIKGVAYGGSYSEDGLIFNELNKFTDEVVPLTDSYGDAVGMELIGHTLKIFQRSKVTTIGNLVNENYNADGSYYQVAINVTLGNPSPLTDDYGTVFAKSIVPVNGYIYVYDIFKHCVFRNANNGNEDVSKYGMANFWKVRSKALLVSGIDNLKVHAVFDYILGMYIITVIDTITSTNSFTLGFHEASNSWKTFFSFLPDGYAVMSDNRLFSYNDNLLYEHHINTLRNTFFGANGGYYITFVINEGGQQVFESLWLNSNEILESPEDDDIIIHEDGNIITDSDNYTRHRIKMQSRLKEGLFNPLEGLFKAPYLRNMLTSSTTPSQYDLIHGDVLRGRYLQQTLRGDSTSEVHLRSVTVNSSISSGN